MMAALHPGAAVVPALILVLVLGSCASGTAAEIGSVSETAQETVPDAAESAETKAADPEPGGEAGPIASACPLLAGIDVEVLLGESAAEPIESAGICTIDPADSASPASLVLQVVGAPNGQSYFERDKSLLGADTEIADLGDEAYTSGKRVNVLAGDNYFYLQVLRDPMGGAGQLDDGSLLAAARQVFATSGW